MLVKNVRMRLSRPRSCGGISQAKTGSSAKASASTSPSRAASSRRAARTAWEPPRGDTVSWVTGLLLFARARYWPGDRLATPSVEAHHRGLGGPAHHASPEVRQRLPPLSGATNLAARSYTESI